MKIKRREIIKFMKEEISALCLSEAVRVNTRKWEMEKRKRVPKQLYASWMFKIGDTEMSFSGRYGDQVKRAKLVAQKKGITDIELLT